ncbi:biliverdin-producing heme oxygenase [uncultured Jatrophihabitans sp.]|uniref:biliverdin-producing heme oxygenase n=1 Tax=uncultured Jatrophihabitans sp. TaxID=1610747 RepID=UPI0035CCA93B
MLKERTADSHECVEARLDLTDPALDLARLRDIVTGLHGFWAGTEPVLDEWAAARPALADALRWPRRRRTARLARDVALLAGRLGPPAPPVTGRAGTADVFGWLYVAEGSTLGGAIITRALARLRPGLRLECFTPYDEGPGPMWKAFQTQLERWTAGDEQRVEQVAAAAVATFAALVEWTAPLTREAVA